MKHLLRILATSLLMLSLSAFIANAELIIIDNGAQYAHKKLYGLKDASGRIVLPVKYHVIQILGQDRYACEDDSRKFALFDGSGRQLTSFRFDGIQHFYNGYASVVNNTKHGRINLKGEIVVPLNYTQIGPVNTADGTSMLMNRTGKIVKIGYLDAQSRVIAEPIYEAGNTFREGRACVKQNGRWGFIDHSGRMVIQPKFVGSGYFFNGKVKMVYPGGKKVEIDLNGNETEL